MAINDYLQASKYELFIRNAYSCNRGNRYGADLNYMQNAMTMERGETFAKHLGSFQKQFNKVKDYVGKALLKLSKTKPYSTEKNFFIELFQQHVYINNTEDLMEIVIKALDKISEIKKVDID